MSHNFTSLLQTTKLLKPLHQDTHFTSNDKSMEDQRARAYSVGVYLDTRQKSLGSVNRVHVNNLDIEKSQLILQIAHDYHSYEPSY